MHLGKLKTALLAAVLSVGTLAAQDRGPLTNQRVYELVAAGVSNAEILRVIASAPKIDFNLGPAFTDALTKAGVSEEIIQAMAARENGLQPSPLPFPVASSAASFASTATATPLKVRTTAEVVRGKPRVFVEGSNDSWSFQYGKGGKGGSHPQTVELMKTFGQSCPNLTVTDEAQNADYRVTFERESSKVWRRDNKMVVFNSSGDMVYAASTRELGNAVRGFCRGL
jgi:hypothetical protein